MEFSDKVNYVVLSNNADKKFMSMFGMYQVIDVLPFEKLKNTLEMFPSKRVIFNESLSSLSNKEKKEIFDLLITNKTTKEIAKKLGISEKTVRNHISNVMQKLGVKGRACAVIELIKLNEITL